MPSDSVDIAIVTVTRDEYEAFRSLLPDATHVPGEDDEPNTFGWQKGTIERQGSTSYAVALGCASQHTNAVASNATRDAIDIFSPRYVILAGIAGGLPKDGCARGDVVVSNVIYAYQYGKALGLKFVPRGNFTYRCDGPLIASANVYAGRWLESRRKDRPEDATKVLVGPVASGDALVEDAHEGILADVLKVCTDLQAVEMEGAGASGAVEYARERGRTVGFIMVRGISDLPQVDGSMAPAEIAKAHSAERASWTKAAAENAASFTISWIRAGWLVEPRSARFRTLEYRKKCTLPPARLSTGILASKLGAGVRVKAIRAARKKPGDQV